MHLPTESHTRTGQPRAPYLIFPIRREYNTLAGNETLEDYALRFTATGARRWSIRRVAATALGATSFLALEAIAAGLTLNYGVSNTLWAIFAVSALIFLIGIPIVSAAAKHGLDIDLLTRGAGFGYIGSTVTSLIYASFTFLFFAIEAAIMASALDALFGIPPTAGYVLCALGVIPVVTHGITAISRFQSSTLWFWLFVQVAALAAVWVEYGAKADDWLAHAPPAAVAGGTFELAMFGAASAALFALIAQIGEQVDYLRFMPQQTAANRRQWWFWLIAAGPGWTVIGVIKMLFGSFVAYLVIEQGWTEDHATDPVHLYRFAIEPLLHSEALALWCAGIFVIVSQLKINVTNAYAGSIAWSNFFSRLTHSHPGRVVWLVFNVAIALVLMELGIYRALESILGVFAVVAVSWLATISADLCINRPLGLRPADVEFKRAYLHDVNPVGVVSMLVASVTGISAYLGAFGQDMQALAHFLSIVVCFITTPLMAVLTRGAYYIARRELNLQHSLTVPIDPAGALRTGTHAHGTSAQPELHACRICEKHFETQDTSYCPAYCGPICSLCCSLDSRCMDLCKPGSRFSDQLQRLLAMLVPARWMERIHPDVVRFLLAFGTAATLLAAVFAVVHAQMSRTAAGEQVVLEQALLTLYFLLLIGSGVFVWLYLLAQQSRELAVQESSRQTRRLLEEIEAHKVTDLALQKAKEFAEQANEAKNRYLAGISHELRTPLQSIIGYAQLLIRRPDVPSRHADALQVIRRNGEHLADLIEGLLDVSRIEAGRLELTREAVNLGEMLQQIVDMFGTMAAEKGIAFHYRVEGHLPVRVHTDSKRLRQILINLLSNAIKYTVHGSVEFHVKWRNQVARFEIIDTGVGINAADLERIFQPFERIRNNGLSHVHGTGLGLTIVKLMTEIMGGDLQVESTPGQGSRFSLSMLLSSADTGSLRSTGKRTLKGYQGRRRTVLLVDDDPDFRALAAELLGLLGFPVTTAASASECRETLARMEPDLMLLDVNLPDANGLELARELRRGQLGCPIVMVSAQAGGQPEWQSGNVPHDDYLVKPVSEKRLLACIGELLLIDWETAAPAEQVLTTEERGTTGRADTGLVNSSLRDHPSVRELASCARLGYRRGVMALLDDIDAAGILPDELQRNLRNLASRMQFDQLANTIEAIGREHPVASDKGAAVPEHPGSGRS